MKGKSTPYRECFFAILKVFVLLVLGAGPFTIDHSPFTIPTPPLGAGGCDGLCSYLLYHHLLLIDLFFFLVQYANQVNAFGFGC